MAEGKPLIVQSDLSLLLDVHDSGFEEARSAIGAFAALEKSPEHLHTYRISPLSLWNAASAGLSPAQVEAALERWSRYEVPPDVGFIVRDTMSRFGRLVLRASAGASAGEIESELFLSCSDPGAETELASSKKLEKWLSPVRGGFLLRLTDRGTVKRELLRLGWPVKDEAPLVPGDPLELKLLPRRASGGDFDLRPYQTDALLAFLGGGLPGS
ncbi:MAG: helicase-associated domain-containing protein, partial [Spirochaetaceae bacterium]|nr:helicase-associated domain-containing protein [Spirochaetaceae bacterium]